MPVALDLSEPIHPHHKHWPPHKQWTRDECAALQRTGLIAAERCELIERELIQNWQEPSPHVWSITFPYRVANHLNFHRPCGFATVTTDARGKRKRIYKAEDYMTPYEKLGSLSDAKTLLKPGISIALLELQATALSDTEYAKRMSAAKKKLLRVCKMESPFPPRFP